MKTSACCLAIINFAFLTFVSSGADVQRSSAESGADQGSRTNVSARKFEYRVCTVQFGRVTFVNQLWIGKVPIKDGNTDKAVASCPWIHEYLQEVGREGWELVGCFSHRAGVNSNVADDTTQTLFLKRER